MLTSIQLMGSRMRAVTVGRGGVVLYSDGNSISYFVDDCSASLSAAAKSVLCQKSGQVILPNGDNNMVDRGISSLALDKNPATSLQTRYLYVASTTTHSIYRLLLTLDGGTATAGGWTLFAGRGYSGFADGGLATALFNTPTELELSSDGARLFVSDYGNNRIRLIDLRASSVTTFIGNGMPCWRSGPLLAPANSYYPTDQATLPESYCTGYSGSATAYHPLGIGLSRDNAQLHVAMFQEDSVGTATTPTQGANTLSRLCSFVPDLAQNTVETCRTDVPNSRSCFLWQPYDVAATDQ
jgi:hypothetical protein